MLSVYEGVFMKAKDAFYDIFRIENGKIVEHRDAIEKIISESEAKNNYGKLNF
jgi:predicted SnoaL-like aldol condensation-catalyzing enzyme